MCMSRGCWFICDLFGSSVLVSVGYYQDLVMMGWSSLDFRLEQITWSRSRRSLACLSGLWLWTGLLCAGLSLQLRAPQASRHVPQLCSAAVSAAARLRRDAGPRQRDVLLSAASGRCCKHTRGSGSEGSRHGGPSQAFRERLHPDLLLGGRGSRYDTHTLQQCGSAGSPLMCRCSHRAAV